MRDIKSWEDIWKKILLNGINILLENGNDRIV